MSALAEWLRAWGALGLFLAATLDSVVPLAHVVDPMVIWLSWTRRDPVTYALLASLGSVAGCTLLFLAVRRGGERLVAGRIPPERRARVQRLLDRWGLLAIAAGGILPPPFPLKALVLLAGLARMRTLAFAGGLALGRLFRYGLEAALAVFWGERVLRFMKESYPLVALAAALLLVAAWALVRRLTRAPAAPGPPVPRPGA